MNIDTLNMLQGIVRRESRSLPQYVGESFPWIKAGESEALARIRDVIHEEQAAVVALAELLARKRHRMPPFVGPYPMSFTSINYVTLDYLVPLLVDYQKQSIAHLQRDLPRIDDEEVAAQAQKILEIKKRHLEVLQHLAGTLNRIDSRSPNDQAARGGPNH